MFSNVLINVKSNVAVYQSHKFQKRNFKKFTICRIKLDVKNIKENVKENEHLSKKIYLLVLQFYLKFQEDTKKDYVKNATLLDFYPILPCGSKLRGGEFNA